MNQKNSPADASTGGIFISPERVNLILPEGGSPACPKGSITRAFSTSNVTDNVADEYNERQLLILDIQKRHVADKEQYVADKIVPNTKYLAETLRVSRKTIQRELTQLQAKGVVRWIGTDRNGYWVVTNQ